MDKTTELIFRVVFMALFVLGVFIPPFGAGLILLTILLFLIVICLALFSPGIK